MFKLKAVLISGYYSPRLHLFLRIYLTPNKITLIPIETLLSTKYNLVSVAFRQKNY